MRSLPNCTRSEPEYHRARPIRTEDWWPDEPHRSPCRLVDDVLVVFEGPRRLLWERRSPAWWRPVRLWPDEAERAAVLERIDRNEAVLVVLEQLPCSVPLLEEEAYRTPAELARLLTDEDGTAIRVPGLDWLPEAWRRRGENFARQARTLLAARPPLQSGSHLADRRAAAPLGFAVPTGARLRCDAETAVLSWS